MIIEIILSIGLLVFPLILFSRAIHHKTGMRRLFRFLRKADNLADGFTDSLVDYYQIIAFVPNVVGAFGSIVSSSYASLGISQVTALQILFSHLTLLVISAVGLGLLKIALNKVPPAVLGEWILSWAVISGSLLFLYLLVLVYQEILLSLLLVMVVLTVIYVAAVIYYVVSGSAETYVDGVKKWSKKPV